MKPRSPYSNLYAKLGISPTASPAAIEAAYRVLEKAYRPDGTYADDVMHQAFLEISSAAAILGNPKTRKLYDLGYIDETGRPTPAGVARAARGRRAAIVSGALAAVIAGLFIINFWGPAPQVNHRSVRANPPPQKIAAAEPPSVSASPPLEPAAKSEANAAASDSPSGRTPTQANAQDYLPPADVAKPPSETAGTPSQPIEEPSNPHRRTYREYSRAPGSVRHTQRMAGNAEQGSEAGSSEAAAAEFWERDIWFPDPRHSSGRAGSNSAALKSAQCLACLTGGGANCSKACP